MKRMLIDKIFLKKMKKIGHLFFQQTLILIVLIFLGGQEGLVNDPTPFLWGGMRFSMNKWGGNPKSGEIDF